MARRPKHGCARVFTLFYKRLWIVLAVSVSSGRLLPAVRVPKPLALLRWRSQHILKRTIDIIRNNRIVKFTLRYCIATWL
jgi:hypothetical protein